MHHLQSLKARLQERIGRFYKIRYDDFVGEVSLFLAFVRADSYTAALLDLIDADQTITYDQWWDEASSSGKLSLPVSESARAKVCMGILTDCIENTNPDAHFHWANWLGSVASEDGVARYLAMTVIDPFANFLLDRIEESSNVLYLLQRFKVQAEWFRREDLYRVYTEDMGYGEKRLDETLRESLFDGGIDYPFSEPASPSGRTDIVAALGSDDPLVLEVKIFDPKHSRGRGHIRQGFHQVVKYANDYNESVGYLVAFNCSNGLLSFQTSDGEQAAEPPRVVYGGKTIYLIAIDIGINRVSASKEKPASRIDISYEELTG